MSKGGLSGIGVRLVHWAPSRTNCEQGGKPVVFNRKEKSDAQKREETKKELKSLLTKYIGCENSKYAVSNAQHKIGILNTRHDKAAEEMQKCN